MFIQCVMGNSWDHYHGCYLDGVFGAHHDPGDDTLCSTLALPTVVMGGGGEAGRTDMKRSWYSMIDT